MCKINLLGVNTIVNKTVHSYAIDFNGKYRIPRFGRKFYQFFQKYMVGTYYTLYKSDNCSCILSFLEFECHNY